MANTSDARIQNAATANGPGGELKVAGLGIVAFQVKGTFVATANFEGSVDGQVFVSVRAVPLGGGPPSATATEPGIWVAPCAGLAEVRARISDYISGAVTIDAMATLGDADALLGGVLPTSLGVKAAGASLPVVVSSADSLIEITPDDDLDLAPFGIRALWVGSEGDLVVQAVNDPAPRTIFAAKGLLPVRAIRVMEASSAADITGFA